MSRAADPFVGRCARCSKPKRLFRSVLAPASASTPRAIQSTVARVRLTCLGPTIKIGALAVPLRAITCNLHEIVIGREDAGRVGRRSVPREREGLAAAAAE